MEHWLILGSFLGIGLQPLVCSMVHRRPFSVAALTCAKVSSDKEADGDTPAWQLEVAQFASHMALILPLYEKTALSQTTSFAYSSDSTS